MWTTISTRRVRRNSLSVGSHGAPGTWTRRPRSCAMAVPVQEGDKRTVMEMEVDDVG